VFARSFDKDEDYSDNATRLRIPYKPTVATRSGEPLSRFYQAKLLDSQLGAVEEDKMG